MSKKVIRLTEADIEKIVRQVIEEQRRRGQKDKGDLRDAPKRKKYKELEVPNWKGRESGKLLFPTDDINVSQRRDEGVIAQEVFDRFNYHTNVIKLRKEPLPEERGLQVLYYVGGLKVVKPQSGEPNEPTIILDDFDIKGSSLPYADNMVKPYFDKYPDAETLFEKIVGQFVNYIENGGGPKLTNVTIKGSADSARPTLQVPSGYSSLDHPGGTPYGGETDPTKMNQYLADTRASEYANVLKSKIKELTNFDLTITVLPGDNYYGQEGKRGEEYRKITLSPNAETLTISNQNPADDEDTNYSEPKSESKPIKITCMVDGNPIEVDGIEMKDEKGYIVPGIHRDKVKELNIPHFAGYVNASFRGDKCNVGGHFVGNLDDPQNDLSKYFGRTRNQIKKIAGPITVTSENPDSETPQGGPYMVVENYWFVIATPDGASLERTTQY